MSSLAARLPALFSSGLYRSTVMLSNWISLPRKLEESLEFRRSWRDHLKLREIPARPSLWLHGASVGELEDLAAFFLNPSILAESGYSQADLVVTASSISAASQLERWALQGSFRYIGPLPPETSYEMREFLALLKPERLLLSHVDLWPLALQSSAPHLKFGIVWLPARATERTHWLRRMCLDPRLSIVGSRFSGSKLQDFGLENDSTHVQLEFVGNLRVDRIVRRIDAARQVSEHVLTPYQAAPRPDRISLLLGSAWREDAEILADALSRLDETEREKFQIVAIPHEVDDAVEVALLQALLPGARVVAEKGLLVEAYRDFDLAWVGGGFRTGLHNVLEPALWGAQILCGPHTEKQSSVAELHAMGSLERLADSTQTLSFLRRFARENSPEAKQARIRCATQAFRSHVGAAERLAKILAKRS
jgi:3-deoxy-D-manno-octulosonic-acid transferase